MKTNFTPTRYFVPIAAIAAGAQGLMGLYQTIKGMSDAKKIRRLRKAYETPDEIAKILNLTQSNIGNTQTRDFQTGQNDLSFGQMLGSATRLGSNPNDLSALFSAKVNNIMKVGQEFHLDNMKNFSAVIDAFKLVSENKAAEFRSQQDLLKDDAQQAAAEKAAGIQNIFGAANAAIGISASNKMGKLYSDRTQQMKNAWSVLGQPPKTGWVRGQYDATDYRAGKVGGIYGDPDPYLMQFD